nr:hypothetical protein BaRGS_005165 [Batillaria attramentaria]
MEWNVYQGKPETIEQAVTLAMEYESFVSARKTRKAYYRKHIKNFAAIAHPLHELLKPSKTITWTDECEEAMNN